MSCLVPTEKLNIFETHNLSSSESGFRGKYAAVSKHKLISPIKI